MCGMGKRSKPNYQHGVGGGAREIVQRETVVQRVGGEPYR